MIKRVAVLGGGMVGSAIALDLATDFDVIVCDISKDTLEKIKSRNRHIKTNHIDFVNDVKELFRIVKYCNIVVNASPGNIGYFVAESILKSLKSDGGFIKGIVDIAFYPEDPNGLNSLADACGVKYLVDFGVAPGCSNLIYGHEDFLSRQSCKVGAEINDFVCYVGGLPVERVAPWEYKAPFSPSDVLAEYIRPARYVEARQEKVKPALSEPELLNFPVVGTLEAFLTDGARTLLKDANGGCPWRIVEKTMRYPGYRDKMVLLRDMGLLDDKPIINGVSPLDITSKLLSGPWSFKDGEEDITVMRIISKTYVDNKIQTVQWDLFDKYDAKTNISSMARTTGYTCTAAVRMLVNDLWAKPGTITPEEVGASKECFDFIMSELKNRNVIFTREVLEDKE